MIQDNYTDEISNTNIFLREHRDIKVIILPELSGWEYKGASLVYRISEIIVKRSQYMVFCCHLVVRRDTATMIPVKASPQYIFNDTVFITPTTPSLQTTNRPDSLCTKCLCYVTAALYQVLHQRGRQWTWAQASAQFFCSLASVTEW